MITSSLGFLVIYNTRIKIGIDSHLLTGHSIKCKSCSNFRYTFRTFVDNYELNDYKDKIYDNTNNKITGTNELTEYFDNFAGITCG